MPKVMTLASFLLLFSHSLIAQSYQNQIAVLNLDAVGISPNESLTLTDRLRSELVQSGSFTVIERSEMDAILNEQGFQQAGCTSDECAVEIGKLLNIQRICAGSVGKVGTIYTISLRMIAVETGEILTTVTEDCACPIEEVLTSSMKKVADKLVIANKSYVGVGIMGKGQGDIYLKSNPAAATVYIDGKKQNEVTPTTVKSLKSGEHLVKVVKGDYVGSKVVTVIPNDIVELNIALGKAKGGLKVYSNPAEADIYLSDQFYGKTPKIIRDLPAGDYFLSLRKGGYMEAKRNVRVNPEEFSDVDVNIVKPSALYITSDPANASVYVRGQEMGKTPLRLDQLYPEKVLVELQQGGYKTERKYLVLKEAFTTNENFVVFWILAGVFMIIPLLSLLIKPYETKGKTLEDVQEER